MLPELNVATGDLPLGRFPATLIQIKQRFVDSTDFSSSKTRAEIWDHFQTTLDQVQKVVPVAWIWLGGSFLTARIDPDDIDIVIWCNEAEINQVEDESDRNFLGAVGTNKLREYTGLRVDSRICIWHIAPETGVQNNIPHNKYVKERGFWDDFWLRKRSGSKGDPVQFEDALPKRGYLEVWLGGVE